MNKSNLWIVFRWIAFVLFLCLPLVYLFIIVSAAMETLQDRDGKCSSVPFSNL